MVNQKAKITIATITISVFIYLITGIIDLQLVQGEKYYYIASKGNQSEQITQASRGLIYDVNGVKLAINNPSYTAYLLTKEFTKDDEEIYLVKVSQLLTTDYQDLVSKYKQVAYDKNSKRLSNVKFTIANNINYDQYFEIKQIEDDFPGLYAEASPSRKYESGSIFANIVGYVGDPSESDVKNGINVQSIVGKTGIEKYYDQFLRGTEGLVIREKDPITKEYKYYETKQAQSGNNVYLTIDSNWQSILYRSMEKRILENNAFAGSGVIINSRTGEVKAMVNYPSYDNNAFIGGISSKEYNALISDPHQPLFNRAIALQLPPGSTWKVIAATAALESGVVNKNTEYFSNRCMDLPGGIVFCEANKAYLGNVNMIKALSLSSNIYFCNAAIGMHDKFGGENYLLDYAYQFGIGSKTGIDINGEASGTLPSADLKKKIYNEPWYIGDDCNTIIGQGMVTATPLQMALIASIIKNDGKVVQPHLLSKITDINGNLVKKFESDDKPNVNASSKTFEIVKEGMRSVATTGTANSLKNLPGNNIAKTGSAEASERIMGELYSGAHSWTIGCFDFQGENYCYSVMMQWGGWGYRSTSIIKDFQECINYNKCS